MGFSSRVSTCSLLSIPSRYSVIASWNFLSLKHTFPDSRFALTSWVTETILQSTSSLASFRAYLHLIIVGSDSLLFSRTYLHISGWLALINSAQQRLKSEILLSSLLVYLSCLNSSQPSRYEKIFTQTLYVIYLVKIGDAMISGISNASTNYLFFY